MATFLNIGLMQSEVDGLNADFESSLARIEKDVETLMGGMNRPELIFGVEWGIGCDFTPGHYDYQGDTIPGKVTERLGAIAKKYGIYLAPGSMIEKAYEDGEEKLYNTAPVFNPKGELIARHRKMCPYLPMEYYISRGTEYTTFKIEEKDITVGVLICYDYAFPEISRNLALRGAEILFRPTVDPENLFDVCKSIPPTRAFENQCFFLNMCATGDGLTGRSILAAPDGHIVYQAGPNSTNLTLTIDIDDVKDARRFGTCGTEELLRQLAYYNPDMSIYNDLSKAPVLQNLPKCDVTYEDRDNDLRANGIQSIMKDREL